MACEVTIWQWQHWRDPSGRLVGEDGSWNAGWDVRPPRWLHGPDLAWMLFGICPCFELSHGCGNPAAGPEVEVVEKEESEGQLMVDEERKGDGSGYRITGEN